MLREKGRLDDVKEEKEDLAMLSSASDFLVKCMVKGVWTFPRIERLSCNSSNIKINSRNFEKTCMLSGVWKCK